MCLKSFQVFIIWFRMELKVNNLEKCVCEGGGTRTVIALFVMPKKKKKIPEWLAIRNFFFLKYTV